MRNSILPTKKRMALGVTLIELTVVGLILGVLFLVIGRHYRTSAGVALEARLNDSANQLIEEFISDLRKTNYHFILGADSDIKGGNSLTGDHSNYRVNWNKSQMKSTLINFEEKVRRAGFTRFEMGCMLFFRPTMGGNYSPVLSNYKLFTPYANDITRDKDDPSRMRFIDRNNDGQYYNAIFDSTAKKWIPELPPASIKELRISIFKGGREIGRKRVELNLNDFSQESISSSENKIKLAFFLPILGPRYHQRTTIEQNMSLDLPIDKPKLPIYGLTEGCREKRFDTVTHPSKGYGGLIVQGQTLPGAVVSVFTFASYRNCGTCPTIMTTRSWGTPQQMVVTDKSGIFTMTLSDSMMQKILLDINELASKLDRNFSIIGRAIVKGETSNDVWVRYDPSLINITPPSVSNILPVGTQKTLAPGISFNNNETIELSELTFELDGSTSLVKGAIKPGAELTGCLVNNSGPYNALPPILPNHSAHTVRMSFANISCYKATASWNFDINVGADATPPVITIGTPQLGFSVVIPEYLANFSVELSDPESGIDYRTIEILMDGAPLKDRNGIEGPALVNNIFKFVPTWKTIPMMLPRPSNGLHSITVRASNFAEGGPLTSTQTITFSIP